MEDKKLGIAIRRMVENVNYYSHEAERAKKKKSSWDREVLLL